MPKRRQELVKLRYSAGLSQRDQATQIGISRGTLAGAEDGYPVMLSTARRIAEHYERPIPELFPDLLENACPGPSSP